jgi:hypothetical protein
MADLVAWLFLIAFEGIVGAVAVLLILTYVSFQRMERNVRRARMFIMADRIQRFLGAFTLGFVVLALTVALSFGSVLPASFFAAAFFFFLVMIAYGVVELFFIVRPRRTSASRSFSRRSAIPASADQGNPRMESTERTEDELHASR